VAPLKQCLWRCAAEPG